MHSYPLRLGEKKIRVLISKKGIMRAKAPSRKASGSQASLRHSGLLTLGASFPHFFILRSVLGIRH
jgi:hypothetical protein